MGYLQNLHINKLAASQVLNGKPDSSTAGFGAVPCRMSSTCREGDMSSCTSLSSDKSSVCRSVQCIMVFSRGRCNASSEEQPCVLIISSPCLHPPSVLRRAAARSAVRRCGSFSGRCHLPPKQSDRTLIHLTSYVQLRQNHDGFRCVISRQGS